MGLMPISPVTTHIGFGEIPPASAIPNKAKPNPVNLVTLLATVIVLGAALSGSSLGGIAAIYLGPVMSFLRGGILGAGGGIAACAAGAAIIAKNRFKLPKNLPVNWNLLHGLAPKKLGEVQPDQSIIYSNTADLSTKYKLEIIQNATRCVEISGNYVGGKLFRQALLLLEDKMKASKDFQVHILGVNDLIEEEDEKQLASLSLRYPNQFKYLISHSKWNISPELRKVDNHVKLVVVDENEYVLGGTGFQEALGKYAGDQEVAKDPHASFNSSVVGRGFRDKDIVGQGSAAKTLRWEFFKLFAVWEALMTGCTGHQVKNHYFPVSSVPVSKMFVGGRKAHVKVLVSQPDCPNAITAEYIKLIERCKKRILIGHMMMSSQAIMPALLKAIDNGKEVIIVTNGVHDKSPISHSFMARRNWTNYLPLLEKAARTHPKVKIYEYSVAYITYHAKLMIVDNLTMIGSYNLSDKSHTSDHELSVVIDSPEITEEAIKGLMADVTLSKSVTLTQATSCGQSKTAQFFSTFLGAID